VIFRRTLSAQPTQGEARGAFDAIAEVQQAATASDWYVTQPDHARISGELAAVLDPATVPDVSPAVARAIALHDMGWMACDGDFAAPQPPVELPSGAVVSFVNAAPESFLPAWIGSIQTAQSTGPLGGLLVSAHFKRLGDYHLKYHRDTPAQRALVEQFRHREKERFQQLLPMAGLSPERIEALIAVLQFCDLASLYICANPAVPVEFPQRLGGAKVRMCMEEGRYKLTPPLLVRPLDFELPCVRFLAGTPQREHLRLRLE